ncbi:sensor domain-containing protein [Marinobacterium arenosum]|uniref:sensor domain-containing protein n=1 Tax=Marinobacterium arenosum TaxID=2862496 RepID=UPI001C98955E|nr:bifunctional diguanylate cyclase/phosphodiesterase [Marinobacterium arenosum]MBY4675509.1 EAL domain-containing protein [Marinobacterium arenosum]
MFAADFIDHLPDMYFRTDPSGQLTTVSSFACSLLGYSTDELCALSLAQLFVDAGQYEQLVSAAEQADGDGVRLEAELVCRDGRHRWLQIHARWHSRAEGRSDGLEGLARDITELKLAQQELGQSEDRFRRLADVTTEALFIHHQGRMLACNGAAEVMFGYSHAELMSMVALDMVDPRDHATVSENIRREYQQPYQVKGRRSDGSLFPMEIFSKQSRMGELPVRVTAIRDLSEHKAAQSKLATLSAAVEQCPVAVLIAGVDGTLEYCNDAAEAITGYAGDELRGRQLVDLFDKKIDPQAKRLGWHLAMYRDWNGELKTRHRDGRECWLQARLSTIKSDSGDVQHYLLILQDVSLQKQQQARIQHQADFDLLTDLPNRGRANRILQQLLAEAAQQADKVGLLFVDLDEFKAINDSLGHEYGDGLLRQAAARMRQVADEQHCVARFGGDEFLVIVDQADSAQMEELARQLADCLAEPFMVKEHELITTASIGLALYPHDGKDALSLLRNADTAMYQAKLSGKNGFRFFSRHMNKEAEQRLQIEQQLRNAQERQEFSLHYQPVVDFQSGQLVGAEALLRWHNEALGAVGPDTFVPLAESTGLIVPIGEWVLQTACRQAHRWQQLYDESFRIAVNVSPRQFRGDSLLKAVREALAQSGLAPHCLEIEVTEGLLIKNRVETKRVFHELKQMGVRIAIDDFGTGYSSLAYLERFPFNTLKIDKSFVAGLQPDNRRELLVRTIIEMAHGLSLDVVAEGVENLMQVDQLSALGCDFAQGYHFSKPLTPEVFEIYLKDRASLLPGRAPAALQES